jgi:hypothetical protein
MLCPAHMLGYLSAIHLNTLVARVILSGVPRFFFCAKRRDAQSRNLSSM